MRFTASSGRSRGRRGGNSTPSARRRNPRNPSNMISVTKTFSQDLWSSARAPGVPPPWSVPGRSNSMIPLLSHATGMCSRRQPGVRPIQRMRTGIVPGRGHGALGIHDPPAQCIWPSPPHSFRPTLTVHRPRPSAGPLNHASHTISFGPATGSRRQTKSCSDAPPDLSRHLKPRELSSGTRGRLRPPRVPTATKSVTVPRLRPGSRVGEPARFTKR